MSTVARTVARAVAGVPKPLWWIAALALILIFAGSQPVSAQNYQCPAVDDWGNVRECTAMERFGQCLRNGMSSYYDCESRAGKNLFRLISCNGAWIVDYYSCVISIPVTTIIKIV
ncbi:MAG: hypothetical protein HY701_03110 [Gemmatimonadetes bacterium]|nr:hypothetical protein [Gemmatimonadota bacterium]